MSGANEDEPVTAPDRQLNRRKEWRDRMGGRRGGEDWEDSYCESLRVMAESGCWVSLWNNQDWRSQVVVCSRKRGIRLPGLQHFPSSSYLEIKTVPKPQAWNRPKHVTNTPQKKPKWWELKEKVMFLMKGWFNIPQWAHVLVDCCLAGLVMTTLRRLKLLWWRFLWRYPTAPSFLLYGFKYVQLLKRWWHPTEPTVPSANLSSGGKKRPQKSPKVLSRRPLEILL